VPWQVDIDGNDITSICQEIRWRPRLNLPSSCVVRYPAHLFAGADVGSGELHLTNGGLLFSGPVWFTQVDGDDKSTYMELTAYDHMIYLVKHLCKTSLGYSPAPSPNPDHEPGPCNLADPTRVILDYITAPAIIGEFINAANDCDPGDFPLTVGSVAGGGTDMTGVPADWPMTIATMVDMLLSTGRLNILVSPGYGSSSVALTNGGFVNDLTGSVSIEYQTGSYNAIGAARTRDMEEVTNALWYLLGPKRPKYDGDISHWAGSITPTAPNAGPDGDGGLPGPPWPASLVARWTASRAIYGYMQDIQIHDTREDEQLTARPLFEEMYANEALIRAVPRTIATPRPNRFTSLPSFRPGDLITVNAGTRLAGGFTGGELVYEYEIMVNADGVGEFTDIVTSADAQ
jgi:hypothetical protein